jgi:hypothetical protein
MVSYRGYGELSYGSINNSLSEFGIYKFPPTYTLSINAKPIMSDNGVNVKYNRYELTVNWVLPFELLGGRINPGQNDPTSVDTAVFQIQQILMTPRLELVCKAQGFGLSFTRNSDDDDNHGPTPLDFKWKVLATQRCVEMSWTVAFHTSNGIFYDPQNQLIKRGSVIQDFVWSRTYDLDEFGAATITTTGSISQIQAQWVNANTGLPIPIPVNRHVDNWRFMAYFPVPLYCKRISQKFQYDPTTKVMNFTLVDKELPTENAYPPLVVDIDLSHELSSSLVDAGKFSGTGFLTWTNVFSGSITLKPGVSPLYAYFLFHFYLRQRMNRVNREITVAGATFGEGVAKDDTQVPIKTEKDPGTNVNESQATEKVRTLLTRVSYKESLFSRTHTFKAEYWALYSRENFIAQSGIFLPLYNYAQRDGNEVTWYGATNQDDEPWQKDFNRSSNKSSNKLSVQWDRYQIYNDLAVKNNNSPYGYLLFQETGVNRGPYGSTKLFIPNDVNAQSDETEIDILDPYDLDAWDIESNIYSQANYNNTKQDTYAGAKAYIDPEISWIDYKINTTLVEDHNTTQVVRQSYDANVKTGLQSFRDNNGQYEGKPNKNTTKFVLNNANTSGADQPTDEVVSTFNGQPNSVVILSGYAIRAGFPVPIPSILSYQNKAVYRTGQAMYSNRIISKGEIPVYLATWSIPYYIDQTKHRDVFADLKINGYTGELG